METIRARTRKRVTKGEIRVKRQEVAFWFSLSESWLRMWRPASVIILWIPVKGLEHMCLSRTCCHLASRWFELVRRRSGYWCEILCLSCAFSEPITLRLQWKSKQISPKKGLLEKWNTLSKRFALLNWMQHEKWPEKCFNSMVPHIFEKFCAFRDIPLEKLCIIWIENKKRWWLGTKNQD